MALWRNERITPAQIIMTGFLGIILTGTLLLMLPFATRNGTGATLEEALFTATSATCVTGLVVRDTASYWSEFGQGVILILIQIGGLGVITMAIAISILAGRRIGFRQRWVMQESISAPQVGGIVRQTRFIVRGALMIEAVGAVLLAFRFCPQLGLGKGIWYSVFHSVSAFCNAGFDLMGTVSGQFSSLTAFAGDGYICAVICFLIIIGGLGFLVWRDVLDHCLRWKDYRLQSKLVIVTTFLLLLGGFIYFYCLEFRLPQWSEMSSGTRVAASFFQSVTPRTAGFNTVDHANFSETGKLVTIFLMLIGGSPGSTAGGIKTITLAVLLMEMKSVFHHRSHAQCFGRRISQDAQRNASALCMLYLLMVLVCGAVITGIEGIPLMSSMYETASAIGTVGLSQGITSQLSQASRFILIFLMYMGRVGGLTMIYAMTASSKGHSMLPQEKITVG